MTSKTIGILTVFYFKIPPHHTHQIEQKRENERGEGRKLVFYTEPATKATPRQPVNATYRERTECPRRNLNPGQPTRAKESNREFLEAGWPFA